MPKLRSTLYTSFWSYLRGIEFRSHRSYSSPHHSPIAIQLRGGFQPLADILKDVIDSFKPYKGWFFVQRDLKDTVAGIFYGFGNLIKGLTNTVGCIPAFIYFLGKNILITANRNEFKHHMVIASTFCLSWLFDGLSSILKGLTQLASPLKLLRIPWRGLITAVSGGFPSYNQSTSTQKVVKKGLEMTRTRETAASTDLLYQCALEINRKHVKAARKGRDVSFTPSIFTQWEQINHDFTDNNGYQLQLVDKKKEEYAAGFQSLLMKH